MTTLVFDTETSGFYDPKIALDDPRQGHIVQLAAILLDDNCRVVNSFYSLIKPQGWNSINPGAMAVHGISIEMCDAYGLPMEQVLGIFNEFYHKADARVAHNLKFDSQMIDTECVLAYGKTEYLWAEFSHFCTMREMTPICQLPSNGKFGQTYKWPKLAEAYKFCFGKDFSGAHDAMSDVLATARIFQWLIEHKLVILPKSLAA